MAASLARPLLGRAGTRWQQPGRATTPRAPMMTMDDRRWGGRCRDEPQLCMQMSMRGAMYVTMTMMRPGLFLQREEPGSEPGNSLVRPDGHM